MTEVKNADSTASKIESLEKDYLQGFKTYCDRLDSNPGPMY